MKTISPKAGHKGILVIGDPHLEGRIPGFRKDNYPETILEKMKWCLNYAEEHTLLPVIAGDLFHLPRSNPNWLLVQLINLLGDTVFAVWGNHDVHENTITDDDSISVLAKAGSVTLIDCEHIITAEMEGSLVVIGGTPWMQKIPEQFDFNAFSDKKPLLVVWIVHHDIRIPGYEEHGRINPKELPGIDAVVNGHIHRSLPDVKKGGTLWLTPGNISRRTRSDITRKHRPAVLRIDVNRDSWYYQSVEVPHQSFEKVFHEAVEDDTPGEEMSAFISGLAELQARRTETGQGFAQFLNKNLSRFEREVAQEIKKLAKEITKDV